MPFETFFFTLFSLINFSLPSPSLWSFFLFDNNSSRHSFRVLFYFLFFETIGFIELECFGGWGSSSSLLASSSQIDYLFGCSPSRVILLFSLSLYPGFVWHKQTSAFPSLGVIQVVHIHLCCWPSYSTIYRSLSLFYTHTNPQSSRILPLPSSVSGAKGRRRSCSLTVYPASLCIHLSA